MPDSAAAAGVRLDGMPASISGESSVVPDGGGAIGSSSCEMGAFAELAPHPMAAWLKEEPAKGGCLWCVSQRVRRR